MGEVTTPQELDERFRGIVGSLPTPTEVDPDPGKPLRDGTALTGELALELFEAQLASRHLDLAARWLRSFGEGFYTIGSAGHEGNAAVAAALPVRATRPCCTTAPARSTAPRAGRSRGRGDRPDPRRAARGGRRRHRTDRRRPAQGVRPPRLAIIPTTSTIASHLPRAVGLARRSTCAGVPGRRHPGRVAAGSAGRHDLADRRDRGLLVRRRVGQPRGAPRRRSTPPAGSTTPGRTCRCCSSARTTGSGSACARRTAGSPQTLQPSPGCATSTADGCDLADAYDAAAWRRSQYVREERRPAVLHLRTVRLMGHAGADAEVAYRSPAEIAADLERDPLVRTAQAAGRGRSAHARPSCSPATTRSAGRSAGWPRR